MKHYPAPTFREILQSTREKAAITAWERARVASQLRRISSQGDWRSAKCLSQIKQEAIQLAVTLLPEQVCISIDSDYQVGLVSVRFDGHGRFHLPANSSIKKAPQDPASGLRA